MVHNICQNIMLIYFAISFMQVFLVIRRSLKRCSALTKNQTLFNLFQVYSVSRFCQQFSFVWIIPCCSFQMLCLHAYYLCTSQIFFTFQFHLLSAYVIIEQFVLLCIMMLNPGVIKFNMDSTLGDLAFPSPKIAACNGEPYMFACNV